MKLRSDYKDAFVEKHGVKLGLMSGFVKVHFPMCGYSVPSHVEYKSLCIFTNIDFQ